MSLSDDFKFLVEQHYKEVNNYWIRNNVFVVIVVATFGGLISNLFSQTGMPPYVVFVISIIGIFFCLLWYKVNKMSVYYSNRWFEDAKRLIKDDDKLKEICSCSLGFYDKTASKFTSNDEGYIKRPNGKGATDLIKYMIRLIIIVWILIMTFSVYQWCNV